MKQLKHETEFSNSSGWRRVMEVLAGWSSRHINRCLMYVFNSTTGDTFSCKSEQSWASLHFLAALWIVWIEFKFCQGASFPESEPVWRMRLYLLWICSEGELKLWKFILSCVCRGLKLLVCLSVTWQSWGCYDSRWTMIIPKSGIITTTQRGVWGTRDGIRIVKVKHIWISSRCLVVAF